MRSSRLLVTILAVLLLLVLGLGGLFVWLTGGEQVAESGRGDAPAGLVHVRSIYLGDGENVYRPVGIGSDEDGRFFVTLRDSQRVMEFDRSGDWIRSFGEKGLSAGQLVAPIGVAVDRAAGHLYVTDRSRLRLICYSPTGEYLWEIPVLNPVGPSVTDEGVLVTTFGPVALFSDEGELVREVGSRGPGDGQFDYARLAVGFEDEVIVADTNNTRVQRVALSGEETASVRWVDGAPPRYQDDPDTAYGLPSGLALDGKGRAFVLDGFRHQIVVLDVKSGKRLHVFEELEGKTDGRFKLPTGIAYLGGDQFAITDTYNDRVQIVRLLLPQDDNLVSRNPWLLWLLPLLLLALIPVFFGRKRWYATEEVLAQAEKDGNLRLLAAVMRKVSVLPEVAERFSAAEEAGVRVVDYLVAVGEAGEGDTEQRLVAASRPSGAARLLLSRVVIVGADASQADRLKAMGVRSKPYADLVATYRIADGRAQADAGN